jgi:hypothetical protein
MSSCPVEQLQAKSEASYPVEQPQAKAEASHAAVQVQTGAVALAECIVCLDVAPLVEGVRCKSAEQHFCCHTCLQMLVTESVRPGRSSSAWGVLRCPTSCSSQPWSLEELRGKLEPRTLQVYTEGKDYLLRVKSERAEARGRREEECRGTADLAERVRKTVAMVVDEDLRAHCPQCWEPYLDHEGDLATRCSTCGNAFCIVCLEDCGEDAHAHVRSAHGTFFMTSSEYAAARKGLLLKQLAARLRGLAGEPAVQQALLEALAVAHLGEVGLGVAEVRAASAM